MSDLIITKGKLVVGVMFDVVTIQLHTGDEYEAQSVYDEMTARLQRGEGLTLKYEQPDAALARAEGVSER